METITVISSVNLVLFRGLSQKDLTVNNPAEHNRLNIRPLWASKFDENGNLQRFDFIKGENECPEEIKEWESFRQLCDNGTLNIKGSYTQANSKPDTKSLEEIKKLKEQLAKAEADKKQALADKEKAEAELKKSKVKTIE